MLDVSEARKITRDNVSITEVLTKIVDRCITQEARNGIYSVNISENTLISELVKKGYLTNSVVDKSYIENIIDNIVKLYIKQGFTVKDNRYIKDYSDGSDIFMHVTLKKISGILISWERGK